SLGERAILGGDQQSAARQVVKHLGPIERRLGQEEHGVGRRGLQQPTRRLQQGNGLEWQAHDPANRPVTPTSALLLPILTGTSRSGNAGSRTNYICRAAVIVRWCGREVVGW